MFKTLIKGTFILTVTGLVTRLIGFIYKIYLSNLLGAKLLGIYQLVFPVYGICFTIFGAGIQTAVSQMIAAAGPYNQKKHRKILSYALIISMAAAFLLSLSVYKASGLISDLMLKEPECAKALRVLIYAFPLCGVSSCINGYYYGLKKASVPAVTQLVEQIARVVFVIMFSMPGKDNCIIAVAGICAGEGISMIYSIAMILLHFQKNKQKHDKSSVSDDRRIVMPLLKLSVPLTGNRLIIAVLNSLELIMIPAMLRKYGMSREEALSIFGILTGMALPFILFPATITNSLAVLLLPTISEADSECRNNASGSYDRLKKISTMCITGSIVLGIASTISFLTFGARFGAYVFHNDAVKVLIQILSFLCPFIFLTTTLTSIINGLGKTHITFMITAISLSLRIIITSHLVPANGISGYLISLLVSQLLATALSYRYYRRIICQRP